jgi:hypothetical protein
MTDFAGMEENAAERKFGPEFDDIHVLSNAQVAVILQVSASQAVNRDEEVNEVYRKTQKYVERFNQMANKEKDHQGKSSWLLEMGELIFGNGDGKSFLPHCARGSVGGFGLNLAAAKNVLLCIYWNSFIVYAISNAFSACNRVPPRIGRGTGQSSRRPDHLS